MTPVMSYFDVIKVQRNSVDTGLMSDEPSGKTRCFMVSRQLVHLQMNHDKMSEVGSMQSILY